MRNALQEAFETRYLSMGSPLPSEISSTFYLFDLLSTASPLVHTVQKFGPKSTETIAAAKGLLDQVDLQDITPEQVASTILFIVIARDEPGYIVSHFISALREHRGAQHLDWQEVVRSFDRNGLRITRGQFKQIFDALLPIAHKHESFDLQRLWGGDWRHESTQLAFTAAFLSFSEEELDASQIPRLRPAYSVADVEDAPDDVKAFVQTVVRHPFVSLDATRVLFNLVFQDNQTYENAKREGVIDRIVNANIALYVASASAVPKPWGPMQELAVRMLVDKILERTTGTAPEHNFVLQLLWRRERAWLAGRIYDFYDRAPLRLDTILALSHSLKWTNHLISAKNELSLDLAALAHGRGLFDLDDWLHQIIHTAPREAVLPALVSFLERKIEDGILVNKSNEPARTTPLTIRTAHSLLTFLGEQQLSEFERVSLQRNAVTAYPRLINYGEGFDDIIDANGERGNQMSPEADAQMQEHFRQMWANEQKVNDIVNVLRRCKRSQDPTEQDLFACMIYGLFDEYPCFAQYPMNALADTAVLFGGIIQDRLLSKIALQVAISMVLEAVREHEPSSLMFKFGLQALISFQNRLEEWELLSGALLDIPGLQGTELYPVLERIAREKQELPDEDAESRPRGGASADDFLAPEPASSDFTCISVEPPSLSEYAEDPDEPIEKAVLFALNNISEDNLAEKTSELLPIIKPEHYRWFARFLVDGRIKSQPNFHHLYMSFLDLFDSPSLWVEVHRETLASSIRMLNAEATKHSAPDRALLKNLAIWLGLTTLARNQAIRYRNISFCDLLVEGNESERIHVVVMFTCKVLSAVSRSTVFRPPCAWTMEILSVLVEIYHFIDVKVVVKFEIEVLCRDLDLELKDIVPSEIMRTRPLPAELTLPIAQADHLEGFNDLPLMNLNRPRGMNDRVTPTALTPTMPDVSHRLRHNYSVSHPDPGATDTVRRMLEVATNRAVAEIIHAVVERSVTIASIATSQLIQKDFMLERDNEKLRESAHIAVQSLSGSLAAVTCKEPLRNTMLSNIAALRPDQLPEQAFTHGSAHMFVSDNIEVVCGVVEKAAAEASTAEIDVQLAETMRHRQAPDFGHATQVSRWANFIPEPFKLMQSGLNAEQLEIYKDFNRTARGPLSHSLGLENGRQVPDVLQDQFQPSFPLSTDATLDSIPSSQIPMHAQTMVNGFTNGVPSSEMSISDYLDEIYNAANATLEEGSQERLVDSQSVLQAWFRLRDVIGSGLQKEAIALATAKELIRLLHERHFAPAILDLFVQVLKQVCHFSDSVLEAVVTICSAEDHILDAPVTAALVKARLVDIKRLDMMIAAGVKAGKPGFTQFLLEFVDEVLNTNAPSVFRADLTRSITAVSELVSQGRNTAQAQAIFQKLGTPGMKDPARASGAQEDQVAYVFEEWVRLLMNTDSPPVLARFAQQLHTEQLLASQEALAVFLKVSIARCADAYEQDEISPSLSITKEVFRTDALAKLISMIVLCQSKANSTTKTSKLAYLKQILSLIILVLAEQSRKPLGITYQKTFYRLFSVLITELQATGSLGSGEIEHDPIYVVGKTLLMLPPTSFPVFAFGWSSLISHRVLMSTLVQKLGSSGKLLYCNLLGQEIAYVGLLLKPWDIEGAAKEYYRGILKHLLVLHHDFPEFLAEHAFVLLRSVPAHCTQMRSLIVSASPPSSHDLPDPFTDGLKVDGLEEATRTPTLVGDFDRLVSQSGLQRLIDRYLQDESASDEQLNGIVRIVCTTPENTGGVLQSAANMNLLHAVTIYIAQQVEASSDQNFLAFSSDSPAARLLDGLTERFDPEARYLWLSALANHLRYPSSHTLYFAYALLHLFHGGATDRSSLATQQQIVRVLIERIVVHRPHPWGLMVTLVELLKNRAYHLFDTPFVKAAPEVSHLVHPRCRVYADFNRSSGCSMLFWPKWVLLIHDH